MKMGEEYVLRVISGKAKQDQQFSEIQKKGIDVKKLIEEINSKTKIIEGVEVKVYLKIDEKKKVYEIERIEYPHVSELIRKFTKFSVERKNKKGKIIFAQRPGEEIVGDIKLEDLIKIAKVKIEEMSTSNLKSALKTLAGSCLSMGITIEGKNPREFIRELEEGKYDESLKV